MKLPSLLKDRLRPIKRFGKPLHYRLRYGRLGSYIAYSERISGWTRGDEAIALARVCSDLPPNPIIVEIGSFLGSSAVLLAGARKLRGSGKVHCIDPFDASGDAFSIPFYRAIAGTRRTSLRQRFEENIRRAGLASWVQIHQGTADTIATSWTEPIAMLFLDGDQSPEGARSAYEYWSKFLIFGGIIALHNSSKRLYTEGHDGHRRLAVETVCPPKYTDIFCVGTTTFARKAGAAESRADAQPMI